jgi:hypothetical protein
VFELGTIVGYRPLGDIKLIGDLCHHPTGRDQAQDLEFAGSAPTFYWLSHRCGETRLDASFLGADRRLPPRLISPRRARERDRRSAEYDDLGLRLASQNAANQLQPRQARKIQIDCGDVGHAGEKGGIAGFAVRRLENFEARIRLKNCAASRDHDRTVVDDEDPLSLCARGCGPRAPLARIKTNNLAALRLDA